MPPVPPIITSVSCDTGLPLPAFYIAWQVQEGYNGPFSIEVRDQSSNVVPGTAAPGPNGGTWTANASSQMQASVMYSVWIGVPAAPGMYSDPAPLLFTAATNIATAYDGTAITISWTPPAGMPPPGSMLVMFSAGAYRQGGMVTGTTAATFVPDPAQTPQGGAWSLTLTPELGISSGLESAPATVFNSRPPVTSLQAAAPTVAGTAVSLLTPAAGFTGSPSFIATLWAGGSVVYETAPIASNPTNGSLAVAVTIPPPVPNSAYAYSMSLAQAATVGSAVSRGPDGLALPLLVRAPAIVAVETTVPATAADRLVTATIAPPPGPTPATGSKVSAVDSSGALAGGPAAGDGFTQSLTMTAPTIGNAYSAIAAAAVGSSVGPPMTAGTAILTTVPTLSNAAYDGEVLNLSWSAVADPGTTGYRIDILAGGRTVATATSGGPAATLPLAAGAYQAQVRAAGTNTLGPPSQPLALLTAAPAAPRAAWGPTDTAGTLSWQAVTGAGGYAIEILCGSSVAYSTTVVGGATLTCPIPAGTLAGEGLYRFRVQATAGGGAGNPTVSGPFSATAPVIAAAPQQVTTSYDGADLDIAWAPVAGAAGYLVTILDGTTTIGTPFPTTGTAACIPLPYVSTNDYSVVVQAMDGNTKGPASGSLPVFSAGLYLSSDTETAPYIRPAEAPAMAASDVVLLLPQIFATPPAVADLPSASPFEMAPATAPYAYTLTIPSDSIAWTFSADPVRADLQTAYLAFLAELETLTATPLGLATVQQAIGRAMPQTFAETLYYNYGLKADQGYVDLRPGMLLRAEYESYQYLGQGVPDQNYLNGYVASGSTEYQVGSYVDRGAWLTGFDRFLATIAAGGGVVVPTPTVSQRKMQGGGGLIDTVYQQFRRPFVRLIYPPEFLAQNTTGQPYPDYNALLIAGTNLAAIETATGNIRRANAPGADVALLYFRGRTTLSAGIQVWLDGQAKSVPLGTSVGNLLDMRAARPPVMPMPMTGVMLERAAGTAVTAASASYAIGGGSMVRLDWAPEALASWLELPMLHGDRLWTERTGRS